MPQNFKKYFAPVLFCCLALFLANYSFAQSASVEFPTAVSTNEIKGTIQPRDLGDARLTTFYYTFGGAQGDIFINVSAKNFVGDIDVYSAEGLRPISKISFYGDSDLSETGRVIYLRKPDKLILRVQGRTPDDNPASFQIKFAGSFVAVEDDGENRQPELPTVKKDNATGIRVNAVGTIIEEKPTPEAKETAAEGKKVETETPEKKTKDEAPQNVITENLENKRAEDENRKISEESANAVEKKSAETPAKAKTNSAVSRRNTRRTAPLKKTTAGKTIETAAEPIKPPETAANPLENVHLVVLLKNGEKIEFPMTEVFRFSLNNGVLTIITKDGKIIRHPIIDVQKMTVE